LAEQAVEAVGVELSATGVTCELLDMTTKFLGWDDLQRVSIKTTDGGPFEEDVWWLLEATHAQVLLPQGANGEKELFLHLQTLPGFDNDAVINAMLSVENRQFLCWQREG
jgi:hypothetical protein